MALRVWLPLNGNINNYGISDEVTQTTAPTFVNNGKIGKAISTGAAKLTAKQVSNILNNKQFSLCFWIYINTNDTTLYQDAMLFGNEGMGENNNRKFSIFHYPTVNDIHWSWMNDTASTTYTSGVLSGVLPSYKWTHVCVTYNNPQGTWYINGEQYYTFSGVSTSSSFNYETFLFRNSNRRYLNDYRIYDHCLSPKEVKEISKGLCLHYKLDGICNTIDSTEWDCSGFGNNGIKCGSITCDNDTPRYTTSYKMVSSNIGTNTSSGMTIIYSNGGLTTPSAMTIAFWLKPIRWNYQDSGLLSTTMESYPTDYLTSAVNQYDGGFRFNASDGSNLTISATSLVNDSLWHHYGFVFDGINVKVYKDGILTNLGKSFSSTKTLGSFNKIFIGLSQAGGVWRQTSAYWSDFRLYATALSGADIKELYNTSASVDNFGNVYGYEFVEEAK